MTWRSQRPLIMIPTTQKQPLVRSASTSTPVSRPATPSTSRCSPTSMPQRSGSRRTTQKVLPSNMTSWNDAEPSRQQRRPRVCTQ